MLPTIIGTLLLVLSYFFGYFLIQIIANRFAIGCFHATWVFPCAWVVWAFFQLITFDEPVTLLFLMPLAFVQIGFCKVALITIRPIMFGLISSYSSNGFVAQIKFELGFSLTPYLSKNTLSRWRTQMSETV
jgi:hypothetical protein